MTTPPTPSASHPWSKDALFAKAQLYSGYMESGSPDDARYSLWSALCLEFLARSALASVSPTLLADRENWRNISYALELPITAKKFSPSSIGTREVLSRLKELFEPFSDEVEGFCSAHLHMRNAELHTGELACSATNPSRWLGKFYKSAKVLLDILGKPMSALVSDVQTATSLIQAVEDAAAKTVLSDVEAHRKVWENKSQQERDALAAQATAWATRHLGHRAECPACKNTGLVQGQPTGAVETVVDDADVIQRQTMLPMAFSCIACGLRIIGLSKLHAANLGDPFRAKSTLPANEFFGLYTEADLDEARREGDWGPEEDFNEF